MEQDRDFYRSGLIKVIFGNKFLLAIFVFLFVQLPVFSATIHAEEILVDEVMASVKNHAITKSQVIQEARIILAEKNQDWKMRLSVDLLESVLQRLIGKQLLYMEASRIGLTSNIGLISNIDNSSDTKPDMITSFVSNFSNEEDFNLFLSCISISKSSLFALLKRNQIIESFMKRRLDLMSKPSDDEIELEYQNYIKTHGKSQKDLKKEIIEFITAKLEKEKYNIALKKWMNDLKFRNKVLILTSFTKDEPPISTRNF